jgi:hypothetical protein
MIVGLTLEVLVTVKTYPIPSMNYMETVCTAGVLADGRFVRLYPVPYRYSENVEKYKKYQWIRTEVVKPRNDRRPESFSPLLDKGIQVLSECLSTRDGWADRKRYVLRQGTRSMCALERLAPNECSLGIVRPLQVRGLKVEETEREWEDWRLSNKYQKEMFPRQRKPLEKIPYTFSYEFVCEHPHCKGHTMMIGDWEVGELFRNARRKLGETAAVDKVREKFLGTICASGKDTHFFVGTTLKYASWIVLGTFWPPKRPEQLEMID